MTSLLLAIRIRIINARAGCTEAVSIITKNRPQGFLQITNSSQRECNEVYAGRARGGGYGSGTYESKVHITIRIPERFCFVEFVVHVHGPVAIRLIDDAANTTCGGTVLAKNS